MGTGRGSTSTRLDVEQVEGIIREGIPRSLYRGKSVLVLTPDGTRTAPLPMMIDALGIPFGFYGCPWNAPTVGPG
jgi:hypothetical protein